MATWSKKFKVYSFFKCFIILLLCITSTLSLLGGLGLMRSPEAKNIFQIYSIQQTFTQKAGYVRDWIVRYSDPNFLTTNGVTEEDIQNYRQKDPRLESDEMATKEIVTARQTYYNAIQNILVRSNTNFDYLATNGDIVITNLASFTSDKNTTNNISPEITRPFIYPNVTEEKLSTAIDELTNRPYHLISNGAFLLSGSALSMSTTYNGSLTYIKSNEGLDAYVSADYYSGEDFLGSTDFKIYTALKTPLQEGDSFYTIAHHFEMHQAAKPLLKRLLIIGCLISLSLLFLYSHLLHKESTEAHAEESKTSLLQKLPLDLLFIVVAIITFIASIFLLNYANNIRFRDWPISLGGLSANTLSYSIIQPDSAMELDYFKTNLTVIFICISIILILVLNFIPYIKKNIQNGTLTENLLIKRIILYFSRLLSSVHLLPVITIISFIVFLIIEYILTVLTFRINFISFVWYAFNLLVAAFLCKVVIDYKKVSNKAVQIMRNELLTRAPSSGATLPCFNQLEEALDHIQSGLQQAVQEALKSEHLKTELITNVSHDLKTPLTSIISYIDLLSAEPISNDTAKEYITILAERSNRLKQLIEDLVEASKAITGNTSVELTPLELHQLVEQALGEYGDRLEQAHLQVIINTLTPCTILVDGRHMWRILENLLANVCKYAMPHTRVYVEVLDSISSYPSQPNTNTVHNDSPSLKSKYASFIIKNIAKESLTVDPSALTRRFVRGDEARSTEGSGLGLAIADSLCTLQGGKLIIITDGDLFKVEVQIPLYNA